MHRNPRTGLFCSAALAVVLSVSRPALAAPGPQAAVQDDRANNLSEVVVTATRRDTKLEKTPIAISAFGQGVIEERRLYTISDIAQLTPGLVYYKSSAQQAYPSIRGTTRGGAAAGADLGVTVFVDDVPTTGNLDDAPDLFDLKSVQVLKGPQGTLFGRNVTGGAILFQTTSPSFTPTGQFEGTYGDHNLFEIRGLVSGPLVGDQLAGKIAGEFRRQDGIIRAPYLNANTESTLLGGVRAQLLWTPNDKMRVLLGGDININTSPYKVTTLYGNYQPRLMPPLFYDPDVTNTAYPSTGDARTGGALLRIDYTLPFATLTSITGLRIANDVARFSTSGDPANELIQRAADRATQETEELRLTSPGGERVNWVVGAFFLGAHRFNAGDYTINELPGTIAAIVQPLPANTPQIVHQSRTDASAAVFGNVDFQLTSKLNLSLGARYTYEQRSGHAETTNFALPGPYPNVVSGPYSHSWSAFNPKVILGYQANQDVLAYVSVASGFKSGGYDISGTTPAALAKPYQPETVVSYEAGVKAQAFTRRLVVNADVYYADYTNLQLQTKILIPPSVTYVSQTSNAGTSRIPGVEVEAEFRPVDWLRLYGSYAYTGATFSSYVIPGKPPTVYSHNAIPNEPFNNYHLGGELKFASTPLAGGTIRLGGDVSYATSFWLTAANNDPRLIHDRTAVKGLTNLQLSWTSANSAWEVTAWGKNVTGFRSLEQASNLRAYFATPAEYAKALVYNPVWTDPASYGLTIRRRY